MSESEKNKGARFSRFVRDNIMLVHCTSGLKESIQEIMADEAVMTRLQDHAIAIE